MEKSRFIDYADGNIYKSNGVITCDLCEITLNRDINGAMNIHHLVYNHLNGMQRPSWLTRN
jgi:transposase